MFRPIKKKKNETSEEKAKLLLQSERRGVLAVMGVEGYPYAVPINYLYVEEEGKIYFHGSKTGHKAEAIKALDKVCFTVYGHEEIPEEEAWAPYLESAVVFGRCHCLENEEEKLKALKTFAVKYYPTLQMIDEEIARSGKAAAMYVIEIDHISGKRCQEK